jgi:heat-inducible transcriptional repressor
LRKIINKRVAKKDREHVLLFGVIELFLKTNKPVGSHTLQENGFEFLSSATIRNYFNKLEKNGLLKQQHSSGGRIPTGLAFRQYANHCLDEFTLSTESKQFLSEHLKNEGKEIAAYLQQAAENLSHLTQCGVFLLMPAFDQDFIRTVKLVDMGNKRVLSIIVTDFGLIQTETLFLPKELSLKQIKKLEDFFLWKLGKEEDPKIEEESLSKLAQYMYNEIIVRHLIGSTQSTSELIFHTGLSKLLSYTEFKNPTSFAHVLQLFEDLTLIRPLLSECCKLGRLSCWIGEELSAFSPFATNCSILTAPYFIGQLPVGAVALLGPLRMPYKDLFGILDSFSDHLSETLTNNVYKYKIQFHAPFSTKLLEKQKSPTKSNPSILLENKKH